TEASAATACAADDRKIVFRVFDNFSEKVMAMNELTRRGLIFGAAALAAAGVFAGVDRVASSTFVKDEQALDPAATVDIVEFDESGKRTGKVRLRKVQKTLAEWRKILTTPQFVVTRRAATEIPY